MAWRLGLHLGGVENSQKAALNQVWIFKFRFSNRPTSELKPDDDDRIISTKPLSGYDYDEGIQGFKSKWRLPFSDRKSFFRPIIGLLGSKKFAATMNKLNPENFKYYDVKKWWNKEKREKLVYDQKFSEDRLRVLGCNLAAAHFTVYRGGAVKFVGMNKWIRDDKSKNDYDDELPNKYDPNYIVEAIDFSNTKIIFEGLSNIDNLASLKWLSFSNCNYFDDWCLDRVSGSHGNYLRHLDISFTKVTHRGLLALYRFHNLKTLVVDEYNEDPLFFQTCLEIKKEFKGLDVELNSGGHMSDHSISKVG